VRERALFSKRAYPLGGEVATRWGLVDASNGLCGWWETTFVTEVTFLAKRAISKPCVSSACHFLISFRPGLVFSRFFWWLCVLMWCWCAAIPASGCLYASTLSAALLARCPVLISFRPGLMFSRFWRLCVLMWCQRAAIPASGCLHASALSAAVLARWATVLARWYATIPTSWCRRPQRW
jgi:hypothetical protein